MGCAGEVGSKQNPPGGLSNQNKTRESPILPAGAHTHVLLQYHKAPSQRAQLQKPQDCVLSSRSLHRPVTTSTAAAVAVVTDSAFSFHRLPTNPSTSTYRATTAPATITTAAASAGTFGSRGNTGPLYSWIEIPSTSSHAITCALSQ